MTVMIMHKARRPFYFADVLSYFLFFLFLLNLVGQLSLNPKDYVHHNQEEIGYLFDMNRWLVDMNSSRVSELTSLNDIVINFVLGLQLTNHLN